jgi:hypothetical protein
MANYLCRCGGEPAEGDAFGFVQTGFSDDFDPAQPFNAGKADPAGYNQPELKGCSLISLYDRPAPGMLPV